MEMISPVKHPSDVYFMRPRRMQNKTKKRNQRSRNAIKTQKNLIAMEVENIPKQFTRSRVKRQNEIRKMTEATMKGEGRVTSITKRTCQSQRSRN